MTVTMHRIDRGDVAALRRFCFTLAVAIPVVFSVILPWLFGGRPGLAPPAIGAFMLLLGMVWPAASYPLYQAWMAVAGVLGWINTRLILGLVFFGLIVPFGWLLRIAGKLQYTDRLHESTDSYRVTVERKPTVRDLRRPF